MKNALWIIIAIVIIAGGYWWWTSSSESATDANVTVNEGAASPVPGAENVVSNPMPVPGNESVPEMIVNETPTAVTVVYNGTEYTPKDVAVKKGGTVTWKNESTGNMWVASAQHPTHTVYDETSRTTHCAAGYTGAKPFDQCKGATTDYSFTFDKTGKHGYHDHINASAFGSVTVVE